MGSDASDDQAPRPAPPGAGQLSQQLAAERQRDDELARQLATEQRRGEDLSRRLAELGRRNAELLLRLQEREAALGHARTALVHKERLAVLGHLAAAVAHRIRNPLATISNAVALLRRAHDGVESTVSLLDIISEEVWSTDRAISDLLDYVRVRPAQPGRLRLPSLVADTLQRLTWPSTLEISVELAEDAEAYADAGQLRRALEHVVRNAIEALGPNGRITIASSWEDDLVCLSVTDDGPGVPPELASQIFEPLVTSKALGLGLGLPTARALLENQDGGLRLGQTEVGARFELLVPVPPPPSVLDTEDSPFRPAR